MPPLFKFAAVKPVPPPTFYDTAMQYLGELRWAQSSTCIPDMTDTKLLVTRRRVIELKLNLATLIEGNKFQLLLSLSTLMAIVSLLICVPRKNVQVAKTEKTSQSTEVVPPADEIESPIKMLPRDVFGRVIVCADSANASIRVVKNDSPFKSYVKKQKVLQREDDMSITPITMATPGSLDDETTTTTTSHQLKRSFKEFLHIPELRVFSLSSTSKKPKK